MAGGQDKNGLGPPYFPFDESPGGITIAYFFRDRFGGRQKPENRPLARKAYILGLFALLGGWLQYMAY